MMSYPEPSCLSSVAAFHTLFKCPILPAPVIPDEKRCALRVSLIREELQELEDAIKENDLIEVADALADIQYVLSGAVLEFGMASRFKVPHSIFINELTDVISHFSNRHSSMRSSDPT